MKRILVILLALVLLTLTACGPAKVNAPEGYDSETSQTEAIPGEAVGGDNEEESTFHYDNVCVDIGVNEDGYYALMGSVDANYTGNELTSFYIDNPALLAFCVSSDFDKGVYIIKQTEAKSALETLTETRDALIASGNKELADKISSVIETINGSGPITSAST